MNRESLNSLLEKLGVDEPGRLATDRATVKARKRLAAKGIPGSITEAEKAVVKELGIEVPPTPHIRGASPVVGAESPKADPKPDAKASSKKSDTKKAPAAPAVPAKVKAPKAPKAPKAEKPKATKKAPAAENKTEGAAHIRQSDGHAAKVFVSIIGSSAKTFKKAEVVDKLVSQSGCSLATAKNYITYAKRTKKGIPGRDKVSNPWPFRLVEEKDKDGNKVLKKV